VFATYLSAAGTVRAILATNHGEAVATALLRGSDIYDVTRAVRACDPQAALFTRTPSIRFPTPGSPAPSRFGEVPDTHPALRLEP
jgi:hypothetical protein